jgi:chromosome segregation ATPase
VAVAVRELQAELQRTAAELATARASAAALSARSADAAASQASQQTAMASLRDQLAAATEATQRAERRERLLVKERDGLKAIINAYDEELRGQIGEASSARIKALEAAQAEMEKELQRLRGVESQLRAAAEEREQRDRTIAMLEAELAAFERRFGQSEYAPSAAKVLHMSANPQTQAMAAQLREARAEIATLKQQLAVAGAAKPAAAAAAAAAAASSAVSASSEELEALRSEMVRWRDKAQSEEKSRARLKETFTTTVATFRDLCSQLVGFRIDMKGDNKVQVRSVYSADVKEVLLFQFEPPSKLTSLDSPFARQLPPDVLAYMTKMGSIPAFLAQLTLHLFSQTTVMSSAPR